MLSGDSRLATLHAHTLKGGAATMGGEALRQAAWAVEQAARLGRLDQARAGLPELERQVAELKTAMEASFH